jgi:hypothetical protein
MSKSITGVFESEQHAARAVDELRLAGVPAEHIDVVYAATSALGAPKELIAGLHAALLGGGLGSLSGVLIGLLALDLHRPETVAAALVGAFLGALAGLAIGRARALRSHPKTGVLVVVRTADSKLASATRKVFAREGIDYGWRGTTVARELRAH